MAQDELENESSGTILAQPWKLLLAETQDVRVHKLHSGHCHPLDIRAAVVILQVLRQFSSAFTSYTLQSRSSNKMAVYYSYNKTFVLNFTEFWLWTLVVIVVTAIIATRSYMPTVPYSPSALYPTSASTPTSARSTNPSNDRATKPNDPPVSLVKLLQDILLQLLKAFYHDFASPRSRQCSNLRRLT